MAKFYVGQRVRLIRKNNPKSSAKLGAVGRVYSLRNIKKGELLADGILLVDTCVEVNFEGDPIRRACSADQLEPALCDGAAPSEFTTLADLLASLGAEAKA